MKEPRYSFLSLQGTELLYSANNVLEAVANVKRLSWDCRQKGEVRTGNDSAERAGAAFKG